MDYELLYDLAPLGWMDAIWPAAGVLVLLGAAIARRRAGRFTGGSGFAVAMGLTMVLAFGALPAWDHHRLAGHLAAGRALVAEGTVASHSVTVEHERSGSDGKWRTRTWESFYVGDVSFGYDQGAGQVGFTNAERGHVPLRDGLRLRVHYVEDTPGDYASRRILRVERPRG